MTDSLEQIRNEIIDKYFVKEWKDVGFFPDGKVIRGCEDVKGYFGKRDIFFVGLNPSFSHFPTKADIFFYKELNYKLKDAHLTDLIKLKATNNDMKLMLVNENLITGQVNFLKREIQIINPIMIIALGYKCQELLKKYLKRDDIEYLPHYSYCIRFNKKRKFKDSFENLQTAYNRKKEK